MDQHGRYYVEKSCSTHSLLGRGTIILVSQPGVLEGLQSRGALLGVDGQQGAEEGHTALVCLWHSELQTAPLWPQDLKPSLHRPANGVQWSDFLNCCAIQLQISTEAFHTCQPANHLRVPLQATSHGPGSLLITLSS
jgi:hypothetical protein